MFRTTLSRNLGLRVVPSNPLKLHALGLVRYNSTNEKLRNAIGFDQWTTTNDKSKSQERSSFSNINDLLDSTISEARSSHTTTPFARDFNVTQVEYDPRQAARQIHLIGTNAGRLVNVPTGSPSRGFSLVRGVVSQNKLRYLQRIQERYIRPAKLRKQQRREWWRRHFKRNFKIMMGQVGQAVRRGY
ncbi:uncharacterized protein J8A68_003195 [[Candida] subhashii]|uniref:Uncharacterized protein n=1 Tax=[Candida] subhashii TaxID=561895 RepID=A0A8J5QMJ8_9ASCO|nr:uncharacterized protein J8A68_003195 [[Candida] subhashii]KAG7663281.1 hypothetical protein J8A68_003195 [[Candida] subhashii]